MPSHVLIVEDERDLERVLAYNFRQAGFDVVSAHSGETALRAVKEERFDLILLDLMLPDMAGTEVCRRLKQNPQTSAIPVIMVTAKGEEIDRVVGFELGADDYVVKPFSVRELILRAKAILRRAEGALPAEEIIEWREEMAKSFRLTSFEEKQIIEDGNQDAIFSKVVRERG